jgi:lipopolysaccharide export system permease protein
VEGEGASTVLYDVTVFDRRSDRLRQVVRAADARPAGGGWRLREARVFDVAAGRQTRYVTLDLPTSATTAQFTVQSVNADHTAFWRLLPAIEELEEAGKPTDQLLAKLYHKVTGPLAAALMPLLGAVAAFGLARSGKLFLRAVAGLALGFAFFVADNFAMAMGDFGSLPPVAAAFAPFALFLIVGEAVLLRSEE